MKIKPFFTLNKDADGNYYVKSDQANGSKTILLPNERIAFLWSKATENDCTKEQLLNALLNECDISTVLALNDIDTFLRIIKENGILE